ncbi:MAG: zinc metallopeptidase [Acidobacteria bacterium]|nr:zinc metallopeptidase [Acidobacteriota bacterium]
MRWSDIGESSNVDDRRGVGGPMMIGGGGLGVLVLALVIWLCGGDPSQLLQSGGPDTGSVPHPGAASNRPMTEDQSRAFAGAIEKSLEDTWKQVLAQQVHVRYSDPTLVLFTGQVRSACGFTTAAVGPFYCPGDQKLYLDFAFFNELRQEFKAPGDFAQAYVIAHEFGHHIQNLTGTMNRLQGSNRASVALELQADCYAGIWGYYAQKQGRLDPGDTQEALRAASAVGDDTIQKRTQGYVVPDSFTHGSSQQRMQWFSRGFQSRNMSQCQTFK